MLRHRPECPVPALTRTVGSANDQPVFLNSKLDFAVEIELIQPDFGDADPPGVADPRHTGLNDLSHLYDPQDDAE